MFCLGLNNLEIFKAYIKNNLTNSIIIPFKTHFKALIFFDKKVDKNARLSIDFQSLKNFIMQHQYLLLLVREFLN